MEAQNFFEAVRDIPPDAASRHWTLHTYYRCAGGSHWHSKVSLSETPLYLELRCRLNRFGSVHRVGIFRLDLNALLRDDYIRPESKGSHENVRLRIFRTDDGSFYVQTNQRGPRLLLASVPVLDSDVSPSLDVDIHTFAVNEGQRRLVLHLQRERNQAVVRKKKKLAGLLDCEVCGFSFGRAYGAAASDYCEVHHLLQLSAVENTTKTRMEDLAVLCANCHRVVHLRNPPYTLNEVRNMLSK
jgi:hypothetical protein